MATTTQWKYLERDPMSSQRQLSIKGRRIKARTLAGEYFSAEEPRTIEEIAADRGLNVEAVREAIAYVESKPIEIEQDFQYEEGLVRAAGHYDPGSNGQATRRVSDEEDERLYRQAYGESRGA